MSWETSYTVSEEIAGQTEIRTRLKKAFFGARGFIASFNEALMWGERYRSHYRPQNYAEGYLHALWGSVQCVQDEIARIDTIVSVAENKNRLKLQITMSALDEDKTPSKLTMIETTFDLAGEVESFYVEHEVTIDL